MDRTTALVCCVLLLAGAASAFPGASWRRAAQESNPDREVEVVEPVRRGGSGAADEPASDEGVQVVPFGLGVGLRGYGFGGRPVLAVRPLPVGVFGRDASDAEEDSSEDADGGFLHPYFVDPMSNFMAQMAEMMAAMRRQMAQVLNRMPVEGTDFSKLGNTTSTTKVVDGHVITVNETVIGGEDGEDSLVHIRVIDVHPSESPEAPEAPEAPESTDATAEEGGNKPSTDSDEDKESLGSDEATRRPPNHSENEIPMKVGSEVNDLNA